VIIEAWRVEYNGYPPRSTLDNLSPPPSPALGGSPSTNTAAPLTHPRLRDGSMAVLEAGSNPWTTLTAVGPLLRAPQLLLRGGGVEAGGPFRRSSGISTSYTGGSRLEVWDGRSPSLPNFGFIAHQLAVARARRACRRGLGDDDPRRVRVDGG
jgi:hypothetical protein